MMLARSFFVIFSITSLVVQGEKDDTYYMAGSGNPNVNLKMYWADADNILTDIGEFSTLYVTFHQCAWTEMKYPDSGNDVDETDFWYQGKTPPMGANSAFSLYGSLKGESFRGCNKKSFITSLYTNVGFDEFARSMYYAGVSGFSNYSFSDDDGGYNTFTAQCNDGYGVGCTRSYGFTTLSYGGTTCNPDNVTGILDTMSDLNSAMNDVQCQQIYDSSNDSGYVYGTPLELLAYSSSCFIQNYFSPDGECPDPFGVLAYYQKNFNAGIKQQRSADPLVYQQQIAAGKDKAKIGIGMIAAALAIVLLDVLSVFNNFVEGRKRYRMKRSQAAPIQVQASDVKDTPIEVEDGKMPQPRELDPISLSRSFSDPPTPALSANESSLSANETELAANETGLMT